jgi:hypothetical protein
VRDAADSLVQAGTNVGDVVAVLEHHAFSIFRRLALDLLARHPDADLIAARLADEELFHDMAYTREYATLGREHFRDLSQEAQATILGWVEAAPRYENDEESRRRWQRRMLERLGRPLLASGKRASRRSPTSASSPSRNLSSASSDHVRRSAKPSWQRCR